LGRKPLSDYEQKYDTLHEHCPVRAALDVIRGRWKASLLYERASGPKRFGDLKDSLPALKRTNRSAPNRTEKIC
jgi:DNA-binding HxlR family transcriptional regulator